MPLHIWRANISNIEGYVDEAPDGVKIVEVEIYTTKEVKSKYRFRMFVDCQCIAQEERPPDDIDLVVLRAQLKPANISIRADIAHFEREGKWYFRCLVSINEHEIPGRWLELKTES